MTGPGDFEHDPLNFSHSAFRAVKRCLRGAWVDNEHGYVGVGAEEAANFDLIWNQSQLIHGYISFFRFGLRLTLESMEP